MHEFAKVDTSFSDDDGHLRTDTNIRWSIKADKTRSRQPSTIGKLAVANLNNYTIDKFSLFFLEESSFEIKYTIFTADMSCHEYEYDDVKYSKLFFHKIFFFPRSAERGK